MTQVIISGNFIPETNLPKPFKTITNHMTHSVVVDEELTTPPPVLESPEVAAQSAALTGGKEIGKGAQGSTSAGISDSELASKAAKESILQTPEQKLEAIKHDIETTECSVTDKAKIIEMVRLISKPDKANPKSNVAKADKMSRWLTMAFTDMSARQKTAFMAFLCAQMQSLKSVHPHLLESFDRLHEDFREKAIAEEIEKRSKVDPDPVEEFSFAEPDIDYTGFQANMIDIVCRAMTRKKLPARWRILYGLRKAGLVVCDAAKFVLKGIADLWSKGVNKGASALGSILGIALMFSLPIIWVVLLYMVFALNMSGFLGLWMGVTLLGGIITVGFVAEEGGNDHDLRIATNIYSAIATAITCIFIWKPVVNVLDSKSEYACFVIENSGEYPKKVVSRYDTATDSWIVPKIMVQAFMSPKKIVWIALPEAGDTVSMVCQSKDPETNYQVKLTYDLKLKSGVGDDLSVLSAAWSQAETELKGTDHSTGGQYTSTLAAKLHQELRDRFNKSPEALTDDVARNIVASVASTYPYFTIDIKNLNIVPVRATKK